MGSPSAWKKLDFEGCSDLRRQPTLWLPHGELVNSPGNSLFDEAGGKFGPFGGQVFIGCQTRSNIVRANLEMVGGEYQGAVSGSSGEDMGTTRGYYTLNKLLP